MWDHVEDKSTEDVSTQRRIRHRRRGSRACFYCASHSKTQKTPCHEAQGSPGTGAALEALKSQGVRLRGITDARGRTMHPRLGSIMYSSDSNSWDDSWLESCNRNDCNSSSHRRTGAFGSMQLQESRVPVQVSLGSSGFHIFLWLHTS